MKIEVPAGTAERLAHPVFSRPWRDCNPCTDLPSDESLGYYRDVPAGTKNRAERSGAESKGLCVGYNAQAGVLWTLSGTGTILPDHVFERDLPEAINISFRR